MPRKVRRVDHQQVENVWPDVVEEQAELLELRQLPQAEVHNKLRMGQQNGGVSSSAGSGNECRSDRLFGRDQPIRCTSKPGCRRKKLTT